MPNGQLGEIIRQIRPSVQDDADLTDAQLLDRFTRQSDSTALAALVRHHGPMVWVSVVGFSATTTTPKTQIERTTLSTRP
ncbi:MAG TPA: hypothetical protein VG122_00825 [Gemmata sp.]|jgi:hypothetical protein|nr:hypothetical protein [Gemmata sp.]